MVSISIFIIAQISPLLFAMTNHIDKHLLERYFRAGAVEALMVFSALSSIVALPLFWVLVPQFTGQSFQFWPEDSHSITVYILIGLLSALLIWSYLKAMADDEPGAVIIFYQLMPIAGYFLSWVLLGEMVSSIQAVALGVIMLGTTVMAFQMDTHRGRFRIRWKTAGYMTIASLCWASQSVIFKMVAIEENLWRTLAWEHLILFLVGLGLLMARPHFRRSFKEAYRANSVMVLSLNGLNEALYMIGVAVMSYVSLQTLMVTVQIAQTFQALYVWLISLVLLRFGLRSSDFSGTWANIQMFIAIAITGFGSWLLWAVENL